MEFAPEKRVRLGEMLLEAELISEDQLKTALEYQKKTNTRLGDVIEKLGYVAGDVMINYVAQQQGLEIVKLDGLVLPEALIRRIPPSIIEKYTVLPIAKKDDILTVVLSDPTDYEAIEEIQLYTDLRVEVVLAPRRAIRKAIEETLHRESISKTKEELIEALEPRTSSRGRTTKKSSTDKLNALIGLLFAKNIITPDELSQEIKGASKKR